MSGKISTYPEKTVPGLNDYLLGDDVSANATSRFKIVSILNILANGGTFLSSMIQTYTNTGTAGGTFYYINLGGIKLLWGMTAAVTAGSTAYQLTFPTSFFSTVQFASVTPGPDIGTSAVAGSIATYSTSSMSFFINASLGGGTMPASILVFGS